MSVNLCEKIHWMYEIDIIFSHVLFNFDFFINSLPTAHASKLVHGN